MKTDDKLDLGRRIAAWRGFAGKSRGDLAAAIGLTPEAVIQWETGTTSPTHSNLAAVVDALGITLAQFWGPLPPKPTKRKAA